MHELALTQEIVAAVCDRAQGRRVRRVVVEIGKLSCALPDAIRFCFDACAEGTAAEGAALEILETPGLARCRGCGGLVTLERPLGRCACGGTDLEWLSGEELKVTGMEVV